MKNLAKSEKKAEYLNRFSLRALVEEWLERASADQPEDPYQYLIDEAAQHRQSGGGIATCPNRWCGMTMPAARFAAHRATCDNEARWVRCIRCNRRVEVSKLSHHRTFCHLERCTMCGEMVLPRMLPMCPYEIIAEAERHRQVSTYRRQRQVQEQPEQAGGVKQLAGVTAKPGRGSTDSKQQPVDGRGMLSGQNQTPIPPNSVNKGSVSVTSPRNGARSAKHGTPSTGKGAGNTASAVSPGLSLSLNSTRSATGDGPAFPVDPTKKGKAQQPGTTDAEGVASKRDASPLALQPAAKQSPASRGGDGKTPMGVIVLGGMALPQPSQYTAPSLDSVSEDARKIITDYPAPLQTPLSTVQQVWRHGMLLHRFRQKLMSEVWRSLESAEEGIRGKPIKRQRGLMSNRDSQLAPSRSSTIDSETGGSSNLVRGGEIVDWNGACFSITTSITTYTSDGVWTVDDNDDATFRTDPVHVRLEPMSNGAYMKVDDMEALSRHCSAREVLPYSLAVRIVRNATALLKAQPTVQHISTPPNGTVVVVGDLHGQMKDLEYIMNFIGPPCSHRFYLFNGDFVDRGPYGCEVLFYIFALLCTYPQYVFLNRGNHENQSTNAEYGFLAELCTKYSGRATTFLDVIVDSYEVMPLASVVDQRVFVVHGGVPRLPCTLAEIEAIGHVRQIPVECQTNRTEQLLAELLWNDPVTKFRSRQLGGRHQGQGWRTSARGCGVEYLTNITEQFLEVNHLSYVIRSHDVKTSGFEVVHNGKSVTVFSASNYGDVAANRGAVAVLSREAAQPVFQTWFLRSDYQRDPAINTSSMPQTGNTKSLHSGSTAATVNTSATTGVLTTTSTLSTNWYASNTGSSGNSNVVPPPLSGAVHTSRATYVPPLAVPLRGGAMEEMMGKVTAPSIPAPPQQPPSAAAAAAAVMAGESLTSAKPPVRSAGGVVALSDSIEVSVSIPPPAIAHPHSGFYPTEPIFMDCDEFINAFYLNIEFNTLNDDKLETDGHLLTVSNGNSGVLGKRGVGESSGALHGKAVAPQRPSSGASRGSETQMIRVSKAIGASRSGDTAHPMASSSAVVSLPPQYTPGKRLVNITRLWEDMSIIIQIQCLQLIREAIYFHRYSLLSSFNDADDGMIGVVYKAEWCVVMRDILKLDIPWYYLCRYLTPLLEVDGVPSVEYARFLRHFDASFAHDFRLSWQREAVLRICSGLDMPEDVINTFFDPTTMPPGSVNCSSRPLSPSRVGGSRAQASPGSTHVAQIAEEPTLNASGKEHRSAGTERPSTRGSVEDGELWRGMLVDFKTFANKVRVLSPTAASMEDNEVFALFSFFDFAMRGRILLGNMIECMTTIMNSVEGSEGEAELLISGELDFSAVPKSCGAGDRKPPSAAPLNHGSNAQSAGSESSPKSGPAQEAEGPHPALHRSGRGGLLARWNTGSRSLGKPSEQPEDDGTRKSDPGNNPSDGSKEPGVWKSSTKPGGSGAAILDNVELLKNNDVPMNRVSCTTTVKPAGQNIDDGIECPPILSPMKAKRQQGDEDFSSPLADGKAGRAGHLSSCESNSTTSSDDIKSFLCRSRTGSIMGHESSNDGEKRNSAALPATKHSVDVPVSHLIASRPATSDGAGRATAEPSYFAAGLDKHQRTAHLDMPSWIYPTLLRLQEQLIGGLQQCRFLFQMLNQSKDGRLKEKEFFRLLPLVNCLLEHPLTSAQGHTVFVYVHEGGLTYVQDFCNKVLPTSRGNKGRLPGGPLNDFPGGATAGAFPPKNNDDTYITCRLRDERAFGQPYILSTEFVAFFGVKAVNHQEEINMVRELLITNCVARSILTGGQVATPSVKMSRSSGEIISGTPQLTVHSMARQPHGRLRAGNAGGAERSTNSPLTTMPVFGAGVSLHPTVFPQASAISSSASTLLDVETTLTLLKNMYGESETVKDLLESVSPIETQKRDGGVSPAQPHQLVNTSLQDPYHLKDEYSSHHESSFIGRFDASSPDPLMSPLEDNDNPLRSYQLELSDLPEGPKVGLPPPLTTFIDDNKSSTDASPASTRVRKGTAVADSEVRAHRRVQSPPNITFHNPPAPPLPYNGPYGYGLDNWLCSVGDYLDMSIDSLVARPYALNQPVEHRISVPRAIEGATMTVPASPSASSCAGRDGSSNVSGKQMRRRRRPVAQHSAKTDNRRGDGSVAATRGGAAHRRDTASTAIPSYSYSVTPPSSTLSVSLAENGEGSFEYLTTRMETAQPIKKSSRPVSRLATGALPPNEGNAKGINHASAAVGLPTSGSATTTDASEYSRQKVSHPSNSGGGDKDLSAKGATSPARCGTALPGLLHTPAPLSGRSTPNPNHAGLRLTHQRPARNTGTPVGATGAPCTWLPLGGGSSGATPFPDASSPSPSSRHGQLVKPPHPPQPNGATSQLPSVPGRLSDNNALVSDPPSRAATLINRFNNSLLSTSAAIVSVKDGGHNRATKPAETVGLAPGIPSPPPLHRS